MSDSIFMPLCFGATLGIICYLMINFIPGLIVAKQLAQEAKAEVQTLREEFEDYKIRPEAARLNQLKKEAIQARGIEEEPWEPLYSHAVLLSGRPAVYTTRMEDGKAVTYVVDPGDELPPETKGKRYPW